MPHSSFQYYVHFLPCIASNILHLYREISNGGDCFYTKNKPNETELNKRSHCLSGVIWTLLNLLQQAIGSMKSFYKYISTDFQYE